MLLGVNITSAASFRSAQRLGSQGLVDFFELLVDNFLHLSPEVVARDADGRPVALHIMSSRFLHRDPVELSDLSTRLRHWIDVLDPLYVSDHLACHEVGGQLMPELIEVDYRDGTVVDAIARWADMLGTELLLENFPSSEAAGLGQVDFFRELTRDGVASLLLDLSNAIVAEMNGGACAGAWVSSGIRPAACHISGYRPSDVDPEFIIDSHDGPVSAESWRLLADVTARHGAPGTLVVERDGIIDEASWAYDLRRARELGTAWP